MGLRIAEKDIVRKNAYGQNVVVVPEGQPIPEGFDSASTGLRESEAAVNAASDGVTDPPAGQGGKDDGVTDYDGFDVPTLEKAVSDRGIEVEGTGKDGNVLKADLIAALEADDQKKAE